MHSQYTSLIFSKNTTLLTFSDQHLDLDVPGLNQGFQDKAVWLASLQIRRSLPLKCPPWEHQGEGLHSVFQIFAENLFLYLGMIVNATVYVRLRWCVCVKWSWCCHNYSVRVCVCVILFSVIIICISVYIFLHLTAMYSSTFGNGWVGRNCLYFLVWVSFGSFSLRELTCMHCVYLALWTRKCFMRYIHVFTHSCYKP